VLDSSIATRYLLPLKEGGSLPGLVEAADLGTYVMKFRGAGQGPRVLVAEVIVARIARELGLRVPTLVTLELPAALARYDSDQEVQDLLRASIGTNLGVDFLPGSFGYNGVRCRATDDEALRILWLDAFSANIDRTWRNPNLLVWHNELWCIDHGAALYFHHNAPASSPERFARQPFRVGDHVFSEYADQLRDMHGRLRTLVTDAVVEDAVATVPTEWLTHGEPEMTVDEWRAWYRAHLMARRESDAWLPRPEDAS